MANTPLKSTFENLDILRLAKLPTISLPVADPDNEGAIVYDSTDQTLKVSDGAAWNSAGSGGSLSLSAIGSTPNANGATLTGTVLNLEPASPSFGGIMTAAAQSFGGDKVFEDRVSISTAAIGTLGTLLLVGDTNTSGATVEVNTRNNTQANDGIYSYFLVNGATDYAGSFINGITSSIVYESSANIGTIRGLNIDIAVDSTGTVDNIVGSYITIDSNVAASVDNLAGMWIHINGSSATRGYGIFLENAFPSGATENFQIFSQGRAPGAGDYFGMAAGTDPFVLTDNNRVGVGTTAPSSLFHVLSSGSVSSYASGGVFQTTFSGSGGSQGIHVIATRSGGAAPAYIAGVFSQVNNSGATGTIPILASYTSSTTTSSGTATRTAGYYAAANTPSAGGINASFFSVAQASGTTNSAFYAESFADANHPFYYAGSAGKQFVVTGAGLTGIGNAAPTAKLHITGITGNDVITRIDPGSYAFTGTKYGLKIETMSGGTAANLAFSYVKDAGSKFEVAHDGALALWTEDHQTFNYGAGAGGASVGAYVYNAKKTNAAITDVYGTYFDTELGGSTGATNVVGNYVVPYIFHSAGAATKIAGIVVNPTLDGVAGTVTDLIGVEITHTLASGSWNTTNAYGLKIGTISGGSTLNYVIYYGSGEFSVNGAGNLTAAKGTFTDILGLPKIATGSIPAAAAGNEGYLLYDDTTNKPKFSDGTAWRDYASTSFLSATLTAAQTTNIAVNDHIKFNSVVSSGGGLITLDTATTYVNTQNTASVGRFTLAAGHTYRITFSSSQNLFSAAAGSYVAFTIWDSDAAAAIGLTTYQPAQTETGNTAGGGSTVAYFTTSADTRIEIRLVGATNLTQIGAIATYNFLPTVTIENIN